YFWDFGDGVTSTAHTPPDHIYSSVVTETTYTVSFTVTDENGCSSTATQQITIYPDISTSFTFSPDGVCSSDTVTFDASSSTGGLNYIWDFGDGSPGVNTTDPVTNHLFRAYNNAACTPDQLFTTSLVVTNSNNCQSGTNDVVTMLRRPQPLLADPTTNFSNCLSSPTPDDPDYLLTVNNVTQFMACVDSMNIEWGDGAVTYNLIASSFPVSHLYTTINQFSLRVIAYTNGCYGDTIYLVSNQSVPASAGVNIAASTVNCAPHDYTFELTNYAGNSNGTIYTWDFGDGSPGVTWVHPDPLSVDTIVHTYTESACAVTTNPQTPDYTVTLVVSNLCASRTTTVNGIYVYSAPEIRIEFVDQRDTICLNESACIRNLSDPGYGGLVSCDSTSAFTIDFGDGAGSVQAPLNDSICSNPYSLPGTYKITIDGENSANSCGTVSDSTTVLVVGTHGEFIADTVCFGGMTQFTDLSYCYSDTTYTADPGILPSSWEWDFGDPNTNQDTSTLQNPGYTYLSSGVFQVTLIVGNSFGCDSIFIDSVYVDDMQIDSVHITDIACHNANDGIIEIYSSLGIGSHTYTLTPGGIVNSSGIFNNLAAGTYTVTVADDHGCSVFNDTLTIRNPDAIAVVVDSFTDITCNGFDDGTIQVSASGGVGVLSFTLNPGGILNTTGLFENLAGGDYTVSVTDENGCPPTVTAAITIVDPPALTFTSITTINNTCHNINDGEITAVGTGGIGIITYTLNPDLISNTTGVFSGLWGGTYSITITDDNNCTTTSPDVTIVNPPAIVISSIVPMDVTCHGAGDGSITIVASGGVGVLNYTLDPGAITNSTGQFTGLTGGIYNVTIEDETGCQENTGNITINDPGIIEINFEQATNITCNNLNDGTITVSVIGGTAPFTYTLNPGSVSNNTGIFNGLAAGIYTVLAEDLNGCPSDMSSPLTIVNPPLLEIVSEAGTGITCHNANDGTITITAQGGTGTLTYTLNPGGIQNTTGIFSNLPGNDYTVTVEDANLCSAISNNIPIVNPDGIIDNIIQTNITCYGDQDGTITINASGGTGSLEYSLDNGFTFSALSFYDNLAPATYVVVIRDAIGCLTPGEAVVISQPELLEITSFNVINTSCYGCMDGEAEAVVVGGTGPYTHSWSNGTTLNPATGLGVGTYTDTITDAHGCTTFAEVTITEPQPLLVTTDSADAVCYGTNTGWVSATVTGGTAPYTYSWIRLPDFTEIGTTDLLSNQGVGTYRVTVYDFFNNMVVDEVSIGQPDMLALTFNFSDTVCFGATNGWGEVIPTGGVPSYTYLWNDPGLSTTPDISNLPAGIYEVVVTDSHLCQTTDQFEIIENAEMLVAVTVADPIICSGQSTQLTATPSGGTTPYVSYLWDPAVDLDDPTSATPLASPVVSTTYTVLVTDTRGCTTTNQVLLEVFPSPTAQMGYNNPCASNVVYFFDFSLPNGDSIVAYSWDFGDGNFSTNQNPVHYYAAIGASYDVSLTVMNENGCIDVLYETIFVNPTLGADFTADLVCLGDSTQFIDTALVPATVASWSWDFGDGTTSDLHNPKHAYLLPGTYQVSLTITDNNGCQEFVSHLVEVNPLPIPAFSAQTSCLGDLTFFTDLTQDPSSTIDIWSWDFGDPASGADNISGLQNPSHLYTIAGDYNVTLVVVNQNGCADTLVQTTVIFPDPIVLFTADTVCFGTATHFTDLSFVAAGQITSWNWDFGDGFNSTLQNPTHLYGASGKYEVILQASNAGGCMGQYSDSIWVHGQPVAGFNFPSVCVNETGQFFDASVPADTAIVSWNWNFGDGNTSTLQNPVHTYLFSSNFNVRLEIIDANGCSDVVFQSIVVDPLPYVDFDYSLATCANDTTYFTDLSIPNAASIISWLWDFGDGNSSDLQNPGHYFGTDGVFTVTLTVINSNGCPNTTQQQIDIYAPPLAGFSSSPGCLGFPIQFTDETTLLSGSIIDWEWNFGEPISGPNNVSFAQNPTHNYSGTGVYLVTLIVTSSDLCYDTIQRQITVFASPTGDFISTNACLNDITFFTDLSVQGDAPIISWYWNFGDATYSSEQNPSHVYGNSGQYIAFLTITDTNGCSVTVNRLVNVFALPIPQFIYEHACENTMAHFTDYSVGSGAPIISWFWDFGDPGSGANNFSTQQNPAHEYLLAGTYPVTLSVTNMNGCQNTNTTDVLVEPGPVAEFIYDSVCSGSPTYFIDQSYSLGSPITNWYWNFGDGSTSNIPMPVHTFAATGIYNVALSITIANGCVDQVIHQVIIEDGPVADFSYMDPTCTLDILQFTDLSYTSGISPIISWYWEFGDGGNSTDQNPTHFYSIPGTYQVSLTVENTNSCVNTITKSVTSGVAPVAGFSFDANTCDTVHFTDQSSVSGATIISWNWNFGDPLSGTNNFSTLQNPTHIYTLSGSYDVRLIVESDGACSDTIIQTLLITQPVADFNIVNNGDCANGPIQFADLSYSTGVSITGWLWNFGDPASGSSNVSTAQNPTHAFSTGGAYNVTLIVTDQNGCSNTITRTVTTLPAPVSLFSATPVSSSSCQNSEVQFTDLSAAVGSPLVEWSWSFGDGSPDSVIISPDSPNIIHTFPSNGTYMVSLAVTNAAGCSDLYLQAITVSSTDFIIDFSYTIDSCLT
ncbi:MAG: hypothetical protein COW63_16770, partial [Bacteroidetes bacterium CG18_big_fil_WC_8_21_14_2_50_41_14]